MSCIRRSHSLWTTCRCDGCVANMRRVRKLAHTGRLNPTRGAEAVARVQGWAAAGYTSGWIASAAGVPRAWVITVVNGTVKHPGPVRSEQVLRADINAATLGFGPTLGSQRRLRALAVIGWNVEDLSTQTGIPTATLSRIRKGEAHDVTPIRHRIIAEAYERLRVMQGASVQCTTRARNLGWFGPLAWDDIDDPNENPAADERADLVDEVAIERLMAGDRIAATRAERVEATRRLALAGHSDTDIASRLNTTDRTVHRWRTQFGIESRRVA